MAGTLTTKGRNIRSDHILTRKTNDPLIRGRGFFTDQTSGGIDEIEKVTTKFFNHSAMITGVVIVSIFIETMMGL